MLALRLILGVFVLGIAFSYCCYGLDTEQLDTNFPEHEHNETCHPLDTIKNGFNIFKEKVKDAYKTAKGKVVDFKNKVKNYLISSDHKHSNGTTEVNSSSGAPGGDEYSEIVAQVVPLNIDQRIGGIEPAIVSGNDTYDPSTEAPIPADYNWKPSSEPSRLVTPRKLPGSDLVVNPVSEVAPVETEFIDEMKRYASNDEVDYIKSYVSRMITEEQRSSTDGKKN